MFTSLHFSLSIITPRLSHTLLFYKVDHLSVTPHWPQGKVYYGSAHTHTNTHACLEIRNSYRLPDSQKGHLSWVDKTFLAAMYLTHTHKNTPHTMFLDVWYMLLHRQAQCVLCWVCFSGETLGENQLKTRFCLLCLHPEVTVTAEGQTDVTETWTGQGQMEGHRRSTLRVLFFYFFNKSKGGIYSACR